jgi:hypothetical protein
LLGFSLFLVLEISRDCGNLTALLKLLKRRMNFYLPGNSYAAVAFLITRGEYWCMLLGYLKSTQAQHG